MDFGAGAIKVAEERKVASGSFGEGVEETFFSDLGNGDPKAIGRRRLLFEIVEKFLGLYVVDGSGNGDISPPLGACDKRKPICTVAVVLKDDSLLLLLLPNWILGGASSSLIS